MQIRLIDFVFFIITKQRNLLKLSFELENISLNRHFESRLDLDSIGSLGPDPGRSNGLKQRKNLQILCILKIF
jgi:hypothetical protein